MATLLTLHHPNLVAALHVITRERPLALVMEYLDRGSMLDWLQTCPDRIQEDMVFVLHQVANGMAELGRHGIGRKRY